MFKVDGINKSFDNQLVLNNISFSADNEIKVIIGLNGCGKSTLLRIIAGIVKADSGTMYIGNKDITALEPEDRGIGYVPQHPALFNHLTAFENVRYCLKNKRGDEKLIEQLFDMLELRDNLMKKAGALSGGFKSRVSLARSLASSPSVMLLDEPLSDVDVAIKARLLPAFRKVLKFMNVPVLYVTHDTMEASQIGDSFALMANGQFTHMDSAEATFESLKHNYLALAGLSESPAS